MCIIHYSRCMYPEVKTPKCISPKTLQVGSKLLMFQSPFFNRNYQLAYLFFGAHSAWLYASSVKKQESIDKMSARV